MFKGGTSLSKGWGLITRFSEDIDLFVNPNRFDPRPGKNKLDKILKDLSVAVERHPALTWLVGENETIGGLGRSDLFAYDSPCRARQPRTCAPTSTSAASPNTLSAQLAEGAVDMTFHDASAIFCHDLEIHVDGPGLREFSAMVSGAAEGWDGSDPLRPAPG